MRIVVFGASGFVGGWVCEVLAQRNDIEFVACVRKWASAVRLARRAVDIRLADLEGTSGLPAILTGADAVINAAMPPSSREPELVTALYRACVNAGVRRFVQFSSAAVYGNITGDVNEDVVPAPIDDYSRAKVEMERRLTAAAQGSATRLFLFRPSIVYGPFGDAWSVRYAQRIVKGRWRELGHAGNGTCNLVHGQDVAQAAIAAATADLAPGTYVLNLNGPDVVSWNQYIERLGDTLGTPDRLRPNIAWFRGMAIAAETMRAAAQFSPVRWLYRKSAGTTRAAMKNAQAVTKLYPSLSELNLLGRKVHYSAERAAMILRITPSISLVDGLCQFAAWCRVHGIVQVGPSLVRTGVTKDACYGTSRRTA